MLPLAAVSAGIGWLALRLRSRLRGVLAEPPDLEARILAAAASPDASPSLPGVPLGFMAAYALARAEHIPPERSFEEIDRAEVAPLRRDLVVLAALVAAAPLLGLLGTVFGMIGAFEAVARQSSETARLLAGGVNQGLITTQFGLAVAIPGVFGLAALGKGVRRFEIRLASLKTLCHEGLRRRLQS